MAREVTKLVLGRGEVYFDRFASGTLVGDGERYLGNTPSFQVTREVNRQASATAYGGRKHDKRGFVTSETVEVQMTVDHISSENMDIWLASEMESALVGDPFTPFSETIVVKKGRWFQLGMKVVTGGMRYIDSIALTIGSITLMPGVDYSIDKDLGRFEMLSTSSIGDGTVVTASYMKRPSVLNTAKSRSDDVIGALRYISQNAHGARLDYWFPQVRITPRGSVEMKSDEFMQVQFDISAIKFGPAYALLYASYAGTQPDPITADSALITADSIQYTADNGLWT